MITTDQARRLARAAYEMGWSDLARDEQRQKADPNYPIGSGSRRETIANTLDPHGILGIER